MLNEQTRRGEGREWKGVFLAFFFFLAPPARCVFGPFSPRPQPPRLAKQNRIPINFLLHTKNAMSGEKGRGGDDEKEAGMLSLV